MSADLMIDARIRPTGESTWTSVYLVSVERLAHRNHEIKLAWDPTLDIRVGRSFDFDVRFPDGASLRMSGTVVCVGPVVGEEKQVTTQAFVVEELNP